MWHRVRIDLEERPPSVSARRVRVWVLVLLALGLLAAVAAIVAALRGPGKPGPLYVPRAGLESRDPLAYRASDEAALAQEAAAGLAHVLYTRSPGGVLASAGRTAAFRPLVEAAARKGNVDPNLVEAIVFLESGGRPDVIAGNDPAAASGLTQILAETGKNLLHMKIDLAASRRLTTRIAAARRAGDAAKARALLARRREVDARFDPARALAGTVRYLEIARRTFGRDDLAAVSYHMGIGNLEQVLWAFAGVSHATPILGLVRRERLGYARVYFDSSPLRHAAAWRRLSAFSDESLNYYWKLLASEEIMRLYRNDPGELERLAKLELARPSAEQVLRPPGSTPVLGDPGALRAAWRKGWIQSIPDDPRTLHVWIDSRLGALASQVQAEPAIYRGLRPEALALLLYLAARVHQISGVDAPLFVRNAVYDVRYQRLVGDTASDPATGYDVHTTGYAFDVLRRYASPAQADAFQFELDRLTALDVIAWSREGTVIHVTVGPRASALVPAMLRQVPRT